ncbi:MAG: T9SS type A sorting domain-containing protein [Saprospiraceae bacterium]|nr:T9SS type A sorting domain-containing protein [Saprospiraceae bacterium]
MLPILPLQKSWELKTYEEAIKAGRNSVLLPQGKLWPDYILEISPITSEVVWEWHTWDHLIQDFDAAKDNYGAVEDHPELIDINWDTSDGHPDWMHTNAIDYNAELDQILISVPTFGEVWIIDHSTTTEEDAGHSGGRVGKGGDLLYRWGNPATYRRGTVLNQKLFYPHNIHWVDDFLDSSHLHYGKIAAFNNQVKPNYSTADVFNPSFDMTEWKYPFINNIYAPNDFDETFIHPDTFKLASDGLSSVQLLPNYNVLICVGRTGYSFEMTQSGEVVWEYITPLFGGMPANQGTILTSNNNTTFRLNRYPANYRAFEGKDLSAKGYIELNPNETFCTQVTSIESLDIEKNFKVYPNPAQRQINIEWAGGQETEVQILDLFGRKIKDFILKNERQTISMNDMAAGIYFIQFASGMVKKVIIQD